MRRGTTPTLYIRTDYDYSDFDEVEITLENGDRLITHGKDAIEFREICGDYLMITTLTQDETLSLTANTQARIQFRAIKDGNAVASEIGTCRVDDILRDGEIGGA